MDDEPQTRVPGHWSGEKKSNGRDGRAEASTSAMLEGKEDRILTGAVGGPAKGLLLAILVDFFRFRLGRDSCWEGGISVLRGHIPLTQPIGLAMSSGRETAVHGCLQLSQRWMGAALEAFEGRGKPGTLVDWLVIVPVR